MVVRIANLTLSLLPINAAPLTTLLEPMNASVENAGIFYTLTFDPPLAKHTDEYHAVRVEPRPLSLTASTSAGYYEQPFYDDPPNPALQPVTVAQLELLLHTAHGAAVVDQLSHIVLTERLSQAKLRSFLSDSHDKHLRESSSSSLISPPSLMYLLPNSPPIRHPVRPSNSACCKPPQTIWSMSFLHCLTSLRFAER